MIIFFICFSSYRSNSEAVPAVHKDDDQGSQREKSGVVDPTTGERNTRSLAGLKSFMDMSSKSKMPARSAPDRLQ